MFDTTLGMKNLSIAFYKISVERGIKSINWNEKQIAKYRLENDKYILTKEKQKRINLATRFRVMKEPIFESSARNEKINKYLEKYNYEVVSDLYKLKGINDLGFFYKKLDEIFLKEDFESFFENLEIKIKEIYKYRFSEDEYYRKIKSIIDYFYLLTFLYKKCDMKEMDWYDFNRNKYNISKRLLNIDQELKNKKKEKIENEKKLESIKLKSKEYEEKLEKIKEKMSNNKIDIENEEVVKKVFIELEEFIEKINKKIIEEFNKKNVEVGEFIEIIHGKNRYSSNPFIKLGEEFRN